MGGSTSRQEQRGQQAHVRPERTGTGSDRALPRSARYERAQGGTRKPTTHTTHHGHAHARARTSPSTTHISHPPPPMNALVPLLDKRGGEELAKVAKPNNANDLRRRRRRARRRCHPRDRDGAVGGGGGRLGHHPRGAIRGGRGGRGGGGRVHGAAGVQTRGKKKKKGGGGSERGHEREQRGKAIPEGQWTREERVHPGGVGGGARRGRPSPPPRTGRGAGQQPPRARASHPAGGGGVGSRHTAAGRCAGQERGGDPREGRPPALSAPEQKAAAGSPAPASVRARPAAWLPPSSRFFTQALR